MVIPVSITNNLSSLIFLSSYLLLHDRLSYHYCFLILINPQALSEMTELLSSRSNYSNYRRVYNDCTGFKVPILGVHLKDLISLNEALPDYIEEDKINLSKLQHLYSNINDLLAIHSCTPPFEANKDLLHLLTVLDRIKEMIFKNSDKQIPQRTS